MIKTRKEQVIDVGDWDALVEKTYKKPYNFQQQNDCRERGNFYLTVPEEFEDNYPDSVPEEINGSIMGVNFKAWMARDPAEWSGSVENQSLVSMFWERNFYPDIQMVANDLHDKGLLPAGRYVIDIDW